MNARPLRQNEHQREQPDSAGRWWFHGISVHHVGTVRTVTPVQNKPFVVVDQGGALIPADFETEMRHDGYELIGWWTAEGNM